MQSSSHNAAARRRRKWIKRIRVTVSLTVLVVVVCAGIYIKDHINSFDMVLWIDSILSDFQKGDGFPVMHAMGEPKNMESANGQAAVLTDTNFAIYNSTGKEVKNVLHGYASPVLKTEGGRALLYDRGGKLLRVDSARRTLFNKSFEQIIHTAELSQEGMLAVVTDSARYAGELFVYNKENEQIFKWSSTERMIYTMSFLRGDKGLVASTLSAKDGEIVSTLDFLDFSKTTEKAKLTFPKETVFSVRDKGKHLTVLTDCSIKSVNKETLEIKDYPLGDLEPYLFFDRDDRMTVLVVREKYNQKKFWMIVLGEDAKETAREVCPAPPTRVRIIEDKIFLICDETLYAYSANLGKLWEQTIATDCTDILLEKNRLIGLGRTSLYSYELPDESKEVKNKN